MTVVILAFVGLVVLVLGLSSRPRQSSSRVLDLTPMIGKRKR